MNRAEVLEVTKLLANAYPGAEKWTAERVMIWTEMMSDLDVEDVHSAAVAWIGTQKWAPSVSEIRELVTGGAADPSPGEAWGEVVRQISVVGSWGDPKWSNPVIGDTVIAMGGWLMLCASENVVADRAHFLRIFDQVQGRHQRLRQIPQNVRWLLEAAADSSQSPPGLSSQRMPPPSYAEPEAAEISTYDKAKAKRMSELIAQVKTNGGSGPTMQPADLKAEKHRQLKALSDSMRADEARR
ncbi:MAG: replicative helicase loader/inhibitor [Actinomycetota bacterium]